MRHFFARRSSLHQFPSCTELVDTAPRGPIGVAFVFAFAYVFVMTLTDGTAVLNGGEPVGQKQQAANSITINPAATNRLLRSDVHDSPALGKRPQKSRNKLHGASSERGDSEADRRTSSEPLTDLQADPRVKSLTVLHDEEVANFTRREGVFGVSRMIVPIPSPGHPIDGDTGPLARTDRPGRSRATLILPEVADDEPATRDDVGSQWKLPAELYFDFYLREQNLLASPASFEHFRNRTPVAGFRAKGFTPFPDPVPSLNQQPKSATKARAARWRIERLELVSLIRHDEPAVYVAEQLPRMQELKAAATRTPHPFEMQALEKLLGGENLISAASANEIRMLGGVRAAQQCVECHGGQRGDLLGAFSYRLFRDPPLPKEPAG